MFETYPQEAKKTASILPMFHFWIGGLNNVSRFSKALKRELLKSCYCLIFLDITLKRYTTNKLKTKWFTKSTCSVRYLNYNSNYPKTHKLNVFLGIMDRTISLTLSEY